MNDFIIIHYLNRKCRVYADGFLIFVQCISVFLYFTFKSQSSLRFFLVSVSAFHQFILGLPSQLICFRCFHFYILFVL